MKIFKNVEKGDNSGNDACYAHMSLDHGGIYDRNDPNYDSDD